MCLLIAEIIFLIAGIYAVATAKLPSWFVGKGYIAEGSQVRVLGVLLCIPLPLALCSGFVLGMLDPDLVTYASMIEVVSTLIVALIAVFMLRQIRKPEQPPQVIEMKQE
jgi:hypothetical protein